MRSDAELVRDALGEDSTAWAELVDRYSQFVFANCRAAGADPSLAQDVSQLVWMRLLNRLDTIREPSKVKGWLAVVARNTTRSELRKQKPIIDLDKLFFLEDPDAPAPDNETVRHDEMVAVQRALTAISERCRELLTLLFSADMSYDEISALTGTPIGSIGPTRQRCLSALGRHLDGSVNAT